jgi:hypothetical protein
MKELDARPRHQYFTERARFYDNSYNHSHPSNPAFAFTFAINSLVAKAQNIHTSCICRLQSSMRLSANQQHHLQSCISHISHQQWQRWPLELRVSIGGSWAKVGTPLLLLLPLLLNRKSSVSFNCNSFLTTLYRYIKPCWQVVVGNLRVYFYSTRASCNLLGNG